MISYLDSRALADYINSQRPHHKFSIEVVEKFDKLDFELVFTSVMGVDRLFVKALSCGDCIGFIATNDNDALGAIDWIESICDTELRGGYTLKF